jgi:hypothetical protein
MSSERDEAQPELIEDLPVLEKTEAENTDGVRGGILSTSLTDPVDTTQLTDPPEPGKTSRYIR